MNMRVRCIGLFSLYFNEFPIIYLELFFDGLDFLVLFSSLLHILYKETMAVLTWERMTHNIYLSDV